MTDGISSENGGLFKNHSCLKSISIGQGEIRHKKSLKCIIVGSSGSIWILEIGQFPVIECILVQIDQHGVEGSIRIIGISQPVVGHLIESGLHRLCSEGNCR